MQPKRLTVLSNGAAPYVVLALGLLFAALAALIVERQVERTSRLKFAAEVAEATDAIQTRIRAYADILIGVRGLFSATEHVDRSAFRAYLGSLSLDKRYPGTQVIHYARRVSAQDLPRFEEAVRNDRSVDPQGYPRFKVKPAGSRSEYFVVQYVEPLAGNEMALGLDLGGDPVRHEALARTRDSGQLTASGMIALANDPRRHPGFAMRVPLYRHGAAIATVEQRRAAFTGMVSASFIVIDLMRGVLAERFLQTMQVRIHDAGNPDDPAGLQDGSAQNPMFDSDRLLSTAAQRTSADRRALDYLKSTTVLDVGGRRWNLHFRAREGFIAASERVLPWTIFFSGMVISLLLFGLIRSQSLTGKRALLLAESMTENLRRSEASLAEAHSMREQLIEALPIPMLFKDTSGRYLGANRAWEQLWGVSRDEYIGRTVRQCFPHDPAFADRRHALDQELWTHPGTQEFETSIVTPAGKRHDVIQYRATFTHPDGQVAGLIGTVIDITERKKLEQQFRATFEQAAVGIAHFDLQQRVIRVNRRYCEIVGYRPDELIGKQLGFLNHPDDGVIGAPLRAKLLTGAIDQFAQEKRYVRKDGRVIWVKRTESLARDADGSAQFIMRVIEDVTEGREVSERYRATFDNAPVGIVHTALEDDQLLHANSKFCEMLGYTACELARMRADEVVHPDYIGADQPKYRAQMLSGQLETYSSERLYRRKDGTELWVNRTVSLAKDAAGQPLHFIRVVEDITARKHAEQRLATEHAVTRVLAEAESPAQAIPEIIATICRTLGWDCGARWAHDTDSATLHCMERWGKDTPEIQQFVEANALRTLHVDSTHISGMVREAIVTGRPVWVADVAKSTGFARGELAARAGLSSAFCFPLLVGSQSLGVLEFFRGNVRPPDEQLLHAVQSIGSQIGQYLVRQAAEDRVRRLAHYDALTTLPNRTLFHERMEHALERAKRGKQPLAVLFIDLDRFKNINDTLGHDSGDQVLKDVALRIRNCLRAADTVGRLGGDEFVVLIEEPPQVSNAGVVAAKLLAALALPFRVKDQEFNITASIGISCYPSDGLDQGTLMKNADIAMYRAKAQGKNTFQFYAADINVHSVERLSLESDLRRALQRGEFLLHYQPKLNIATGRITSVEALVRWQHPEKGMIPPGQFIELAEETGLIVPIGAWVLRTACAQNKAWQRQGWLPIRVAVNLSARQFASEQLLDDIVSTLAESELQAHFLELEITESMVMHNPEQAIALLDRVKARGIHIALDDFGTGYSSLGYLKRFPLDALKIDRTFIRDLPGDSDDAAITQAIVAMAHSLRLEVVAEGVENAAQLDFLRECKCDEIQGYYFSKPKAAEEIAPLLRDNVAPAAGLARHRPTRRVRSA